MAQKSGKRAQLCSWAGGQSRVSSWPVLSRALSLPALTRASVQPTAVDFLPLPRVQAKLEALRAAHGQHDYDAMSPIFEIKQTVDVEAEHAEQEAALKALREKPPPPAEENVEKDEFVKKKGGFMARFLARKTKSDADVDGAIAAAEAQENANQKSADGADGAAAAGTNAGEAAAGANASAANELSKGTTVAAEKPTPSKASDAGAETGDTDDLYPPPPPEEDEHESELEALNKKDQKHDPSKERRRVAFDVNARSYSRWMGLGKF